MKKEIKKQIEEILRRTKWVDQKNIIPKAIHINNSIKETINLTMKKQSEQIFIEIDKLIDQTKSEIPVPIEKSKFIKELRKLKEKWK